MATVTTERTGSVLVVHIDDRKANALSKQMIGDLVAAVGVAETDESISAVVLHGREGKFSAGFDLSVMRGGDVSAMVDLVGDVLDRAIERAQSFSSLDGRAYAGTVQKLRGDVLETMNQQIAADRAAIA